MISPDQNSLTNAKVTTSRVAEIVVDSAIESAVNAFLVLLMGGIALDIVGEVAKEMTPSLPPGFHLKGSALSFGSWTSSIAQHGFLLCSVVFFLPTTCLRLARLFRPADETSIKPAATRIQKIGQRLSEGWFGLLVGNAFGAMIAAIVIGWTEQFALTQIVYHTLLDWAVPGIRAVTGWVLGDSTTTAIGSWLSWYGENQLKFTFWFLYVASVCDDLGIPNFKSLARWLYRRLRKSRERSFFGASATLIPKPSFMILETR